uniref:MIF4G domain-containing protein n=1 Tax=Rhabditophanes sp. KR3021 TaxID=114890 RepID=A0AC35U999_9BILA
MTEKVALNLVVDGKSAELNAFAELLLKQNIVKGKDLLVESLITSQLSFPMISNVYAALAAKINYKMPEIGQLLVSRLLKEFGKYYQAEQVTYATHTLKFLAHLTNQHVINESLSYEICLFLLENPTSSSIEMSLSYIREVGMKLTTHSPSKMHSLIDKFHILIAESNGFPSHFRHLILDIKKMFNDKFSSHPSIDKLINVPNKGEQYMHRPSLVDGFRIIGSLQQFRFDKIKEDV